MVKYLDHSNFNETINTNEVVLVVYSADWCGPCKLLQPTLEALAIDFEDKAVISKINVDAEPELTSSYEVRSIPALIYFHNGRVVNMETGVQTKASMSNNINKLLSKEVMTVH